MTIKVSDHLSCPWPGGMPFDMNKLVTGLKSGVTAAAGTHPSTTKDLFFWMIGDFIWPKPNLKLLGDLELASSSPDSHLLWLELYKSILHNHCCLSLSLPFSLPFQILPLREI